MSAKTIDLAISAANPLPRGVLATAALEGAGSELLLEVMAEPRAAGGPARPRPARRTAPSGSWRAKRWLVLAAGAAALAVILATMLAGAGEPASQQRAFGAQLIRYANNSPLVLLHLSGWRVVYANEETSQEGEMHFLPNGASESEVGRAAELHWRPGQLRLWVGDRAASSDLSTTAPVLGTTSRVFRYLGGAPGPRTFTALWLYHGRVLEFRATVPDLAAFEGMLAALRQVDELTWLSALPSSVITEAQHATTVSAMLKGIPLPPGFDATRVSSNGLTKDSYQLGAAVAGTVACVWMQRWAEGRRTGNRNEVSSATAAMASSQDWPVLHAMESKGAYPQVLEEYASEMPSGNWHGRPLAHAASEGLGCASLGVPISPTKAEQSSDVSAAPSVEHR